MDEIDLRDLLMEELPDRDYVLLFAGTRRVVTKLEYIDYMVMMAEFITDIEPN